MRKLTPEERAAKKAALASAGAPAEHTHDDSCGHLAEEAPAPKRKKKAEEAPVAEAVAEPVAVAEEAPVAEPAPEPVAEAVAEEPAPEV